MKKCLLIAYYFPPRTGMGSQRPSKLAKYFPEFGWEPIILTAKLPGKPCDSVRIIETDYTDILASTKSLFGFDQKKGVQEQLGIQVSKNAASLTWIDKIIRMSKEVIAYPDEQRGWYKAAMESASELLDKENIDVILSTSSPVTSHIIARGLKKKYHIPWVADLRDLWTQNHFYNRLSFMRYFDKQLELKTLALADTLVTVTPRFADKLKILHKNKHIFCVTNGYDTDDFPKMPADLTRKFTITFTGSLYNGKMNPSLLFEVVSRLIDEQRIKRDLIEIRFYGDKECWLIDNIKKYGLDGIVNCYGFLPREIVIEKQKDSQLLLLLLDHKNEEIDYYPAKIFEYFGARRPIIALGGGTGGAVKELLENTVTGNFVANKKELKTILESYYQQYIANGEVGCNSNSNIENYAYQSIVKKYSDILNDIVTK